MLGRSKSSDPNFSRNSGPTKNSKMATTSSKITCTKQEQHEDELCDVAAKDTHCHDGSVGGGCGVVNRQEEDLHKLERDGEEGGDYDQVEGDGDTAVRGHVWRQVGDSSKGKNDDEYGHELEQTECMHIPKKHDLVIGASSYNVDHLEASDTVQPTWLLAAGRGAVLAW